MDAGVAALEPGLRRCLAGSCFGPTPLKSPVSLFCLFCLF